MSHLPATRDPSNHIEDFYQYDHFDQRIVDQRVKEFRDQTNRYLADELSEDQFRPLRLMNGLYIERFAPMLRVAIPYGQLTSRQLRMLAWIARFYDRGYGHITTRQNIQLNWPKLEKAPDILADLATVQMHAIQTSGSCIRNTTTDHLAGISEDEIEDPRPYCEIIRQWSSSHPEFSFLPRKFKIAVTGSPKDRAASQVHDIGLHLVHNDDGEIGFEVLVGGGLGRTPIVGQVIRPFLKKKYLLSYLQAILRIYNLYGRRDNKHKARIKILVRALGIESFREKVENEWQTIRTAEPELQQEEIDAIKAHFTLPDFDEKPTRLRLASVHIHDNAFTNWLTRNTVAHKQAGYRGVYISLKSPTQVPGDITTDQMLSMADLADEYSFGLIRTTHDQNLFLPHVRDGDLYTLWKTLRKFELATANIGTLTDMICCPGLDFCSLANATAIPIAKEINQRFDDLDYLYDLGDLQLKISGCMNACGHHHVGHIGILGVDKKGEEWYQITLGGSANENARIGERIGPSVAKDKVVDAIARLIEAYVEHRLDPDESFLATVKRLGITPFKEKVYG